MTFDFAIHDKITPRPPKYVRQPTPEVFRTTRDRHAYWDKEIVKWHEGYSGLSGVHYFYIQEGWIQNNFGKPIRPRWREADEVVLNSIMYGFNKRWDSGVVKRREFGLTCIGAGLLPFYFMQTQPGCHIGMTSCDLDRIAKMFKEKTLVYWKGLHEDIGLPQVKKSEQKNQSYLQVKQIVTIEGKEQELNPDIFCTETVKDPSSFSVSRLTYAFLDEFPLHKNRQALLDSLYPTLEQEMVRVGNLLWGGTVEHGISMDSLNALRDIVSAPPEVSKTCLTFVPAYFGMTQFADDDGKIHKIPGTENGWDNKEYATELILKERDLLDRLEDKSRLQRRIKNYPLTLDEVLESSGKGKLPEEIMTKVEIRSREIRNKHETVRPCFTYDLKVEANGEWEFKQNPKGKIFITEMPNPGYAGFKDPYIAGEDPIPYGDADIDNGSNDCLVIKDRLDQRYVCIYSDRNMDADYTFEIKRVLQNKYHQAKNMLEMNRGEVAFQKYKDNNCLHLLAKKPVNIGVKYESSRKYGWYKNKTGSRGNEIFFKFLKSHIGRQDFLIIMKDLEVFLLENTDIADAMIGCEILNEELLKIEQRAHKRETAPVETVRILKRDPSTGKVFYQDVPVNYNERW